jgi:integral membrane sensor domain MASE1
MMPVVVLFSANRMAVVGVLMHLFVQRPDRRSRVRDATRVAVGGAGIGTARTMIISVAIGTVAFRTTTP